MNKNKLYRTSTNFKHARISNSSRIRTCVITMLKNIEVYNKCELCTAQKVVLTKTYLPNLISDLALN